MSSISLLLFCVSLTIFLRCITARDTGQTSCETPSGFEGQSTYVRCQFPLDMRTYEQDLQVVRYDFYMTEYIPEVVLYCYWSYFGTAGPACEVTEGYQFNEDISDMVTVTIEALSERHEGVYKCVSGTVHPSRQHRCELPIKERKATSCTGGVVYEGDPASVTCLYYDDLSATKDSFYVSHLAPDKEEYEDALTCTWSNHFNWLRHICHTGPGVTFSGEVSRYVTLHFPAVEQRHAGLYRCDVIPTRLEDERLHCPLEVKEKTTTSSSTALSITPTTTTTTTTATTTAMSTSTSSAKQQPDEAFKSAADTPKGWMLLCVALLVAHALSAVCTCIKIIEFHAVLDDDKVDEEDNMVSFTTRDTTAEDTSSGGLMVKVVSLTEWWW